MTGLNALAITVGRLLAKPATLLFGAATFFSQFLLQASGLINIDDAEIWAAVGMVVWGIVSIWLAWWTPRQIAGDATGKGRFWKWLGYSLGLSLVSALPLLVVGFIAGFGRNDPVIGWQAAAISVVLQSLLLPLWVRVYAVAISGDRVRFQNIRDGLIGNNIKILCFFVPASAISWAAAIIGEFPQVVGTVDPYAVAGGLAAAQTFGNCLMIATLVAAYLIVDRSSAAEDARDVFG